MNPKDTGFNFDHKIEHVKSYPSGVQQYRCSICRAEFIFDWDTKAFMTLNYGDPSLHNSGLLPDWVEDLDL